MATSPFLETVRREIRLRQYSIRTEKTYLAWIKRYILFSGKRHPAEMGREEVRAFLSWLANEGNVAVNTQKTALNALVFLYHKVLNIELGELGFQLARKQRHLPTVLTEQEVGAILCQLDGVPLLVVSLLYGSGLRVTEALRLRVQDIDFLISKMFKLPHNIGQQDQAPYATGHALPINALRSIDSDSVVGPSGRFAL